MIEAASVNAYDDFIMARLRVGEYSQFELSRLAIGDELLCLHGKTILRPSAKPERILHRTAESNPVDNIIHSISLRTLAGVGHEA